MSQIDYDKYMDWICSELVLKKKSLITIRIGHITQKLHSDDPKHVLSKSKLHSIEIGTLVFEHFVNAIFALRQMCAFPCATSFPPQLSIHCILFILKWRCSLILIASKFICFPQMQIGFKSEILCIFMDISLEE